MGTYSLPVLRTREIFTHVDIRKHLATLWETRSVDSLRSEVAGFDFTAKFREVPCEDDSTGLPVRHGDGSKCCPLVWLPICFCGLFIC